MQICLRRLIILIVLKIEYRKYPFNLISQYPDAYIFSVYKARYNLIVNGETLIKLEATEGYPTFVLLIPMSRILNTIRYFPTHIICRILPEPSISQQNFNQYPLLKLTRSESFVQYETEDYIFFVSVVF